MLLQVNIRSFKDAPKPEPIASPSGRLCSASPIPTAMPVFSKLAFFVFSLFCTIISHIIITKIPNITPVMTVLNSAIFSASGIRSKHTIDIINPDANDNIKLKVLFDVLLNFKPIIPPQSRSKCSKK